MTSLEERHISQSGRQRVMLPAAIAFDPNTLLGDTPVAGELQQGPRSDYFSFQYSSLLGDWGDLLCGIVAKLADRDTSALLGHFRKSDIPLGYPTVVLGPMPDTEKASVDTGTSTIYCDVRTVPRTDPRHSAFLLATCIAHILIVEDPGWDPSLTTGNALARALGVSLYPAQIFGYASAPIWLDGSRENHLEFEVPANTDIHATGCSTLFLNYLHHQLGFSWSEIIALGSSRLTDDLGEASFGQLTPFDEFRSFLKSHFPTSVPVKLDNDNPFPLVERRKKKREHVLPQNAVAPDAAVGSQGSDHSETQTVTPTASTAAAASAPPASQVALSQTAPVQPDPTQCGNRYPSHPIDVSATINSRRWLRASLPFPHVRAFDVFNPDIYDRIVDRYEELLETGQFGRNLVNYDVETAPITAEDPGAFSVFLSKQWHDLIAGIFDIRASGEVNVALHHHHVGGASGSPHNDLNPGWFAGTPDDSGILVYDPKLGNYQKGDYVDGLRPFERIRAISVIYYFANPHNPGGYGGETGLYRSGHDPLSKPSLLVPPLNNSLVAFPCSPNSFHAFITNRFVERNCLVMWLHQPKEDAIAKWGEKNIVYW